MGGLAAREGDGYTTGHLCTTESTLDTPSQNKVTIQGELAARLTDKGKTHTMGLDPPCVNHTPAISGSSTKVTIADNLAARKSDSIDSDKISTGASKVTIGD